MKYEADCWLPKDTDDTLVLAMLSSPNMFILCYSR